MADVGRLLEAASLALASPSAAGHPDGVTGPVTVPPGSRAPAPACVAASGDGAVVPVGSA